MRRFFVMALLMAPIGGCVAETPPPADTADACGAASLQNLVGQSESVLAAMTFAAPTRFIHPTTRVTMDYRAERLNFDIDAKGVITAVRCG